MHLSRQRAVPRLARRRATPVSVLASNLSTLLGPPAQPPRDRPSGLRLATRQDVRVGINFNQVPQPKQKNGPACPPPLVAVAVRDSSPNQPAGSARARPRQPAPRHPELAAVTAPSLGPGTPLPARHPLQPSPVPSLDSVIRAPRVNFPRCHQLIHRKPPPRKQLLRRHLCLSVRSMM